MEAGHSELWKIFAIVNDIQPRNFIYEKDARGDEDVNGVLHIYFTHQGNAIDPLQQLLVVDVHVRQTKKLPPSTT